MQQYRTNPSLDGVPSLHTSEESFWSGLAPFPQEYPVEGPRQPPTLESCAQPGGGGATSAVAVHPRRPTRHPATMRGYRLMIAGNSSKSDAGLASEVMDRTPHEEP